MPLFQSLNLKRRISHARVKSNYFTRNDPTTLTVKSRTTSRPKCESKNGDLTSATRNRYVFRRRNFLSVSFLSTNDAHSRRRKCARVSPASSENIYNPFPPDNSMPGFFFFLSSSSSSFSTSPWKLQMRGALPAREFSPREGHTPANISSAFANFFPPKFQTFEAPYATPSIPHKFPFTQRANATQRAGIITLI